MEINIFKVNKLHGRLNFELRFKDNTLILLGENGSCKTTIIKLLYYTLSLQWGKLTKYNFESVEIIIDNENICIKKDDISLSFDRFTDRILRRLPFNIRRNIHIAREKNEKIDLFKLENICKTYDYPFEYLLQELNLVEEMDLFSPKNQTGKKDFQNSTEKLKKKLENTHILYLPTYRRIEQELAVVLEGKISEDEYRTKRIKLYHENEDYTELIEFGMCDVDDAIKTTLTNLKESSRANLNQLTLGYLGDIVNEKYQKIEYQKIESIEESTIYNIMNRIDESILSETSKEKLVSTLRYIKERGIINDHDKVVCHYFLKLYNSHKELIARESTIRDFANICSRYLENKTMYYDSPNFDVFIKLNNSTHIINLTDLSSGEKQIVSLFSHLFLSNKKNYIVLIDEPELSLSVKWQKTFLEDVRKGEFCKGLIAVTHSPFIFDNDLDMYAHGIEEFRY